MSEVVNNTMIYIEELWNSGLFSFRYFYKSCEDVRNRIEVLEKELKEKGDEYNILKDEKSFLYYFLKHDGFLYTFDTEMTQSSNGEVQRWRNSYQNIIEEIIKLGGDVLSEVNYSIFVKVEINEYSISETDYQARSIQIIFEYLGSTYSVYPIIFHDWADCNALEEGLNKVLLFSGYKKRKVLHIAITHDQCATFIFGTEEQKKVLEEIFREW